VLHYVEVEYKFLSGAHNPTDSGSGGPNLECRRGKSLYHNCGVSQCRAILDIFALCVAHDPVSQKAVLVNAGSLDRECG
jgi:hypothetical protein